MPAMSTDSPRESPHESSRESPAAAIDPSIWPPRLLLLHGVATEICPELSRHVEPGPFLLDIHERVAEGRSDLAPDLLATLKAYAEDERAVAALHPTNDNDERADAAKYRHLLDDAAVDPPDVIAICAVLGVGVVINMDGGYGSTRYGEASGTPNGTITLDHHFRAAEWTLTYKRRAADRLMFSEFVEKLRERLEREGDGPVFFHGKGLRVMGCSLTNWDTKYITRLPGGAVGIGGLLGSSRCDYLDPFVEELEGAGYSQFQSTWEMAVGAWRGPREKVRIVVGGRVEKGDVDLDGVKATLLELFSGATHRFSELTPVPGPVPQRFMEGFLPPKDSTRVYLEDTGQRLLARQVFIMGSAAGAGIRPRVDLSLAGHEARRVRLEALSALKHG